MANCVSYSVVCDWLVGTVRRLWESWSKFDLTFMESGSLARWCRPDLMVVSGFMGAPGGAHSWGTALQAVKVAGSIHWLNPSDCIMALGSIQPLTEISARGVSSTSCNPQDLSRLYLYLSGFIVEVCGRRDRYMLRCKCNEQGSCVACRGCIIVRNTNFWDTDLYVTCLVSALLCA